MSSRFVADTLMALIAEHGMPRFIRSDNGPEFIAQYLMRLFAVHGIEARHIDPGSPWQNPGAPGSGSTGACAGSA